MKTRSARPSSCFSLKVECGRRILEAAELVHAVVDDGARAVDRRERERHRGLEPERRPLAAGIQVVGDQRLLGERSPLGPRGPPGARARSTSTPSVRRSTRSAACRHRLEHGLLDEEDPSLTRESAHQVLRTLVHEIPAEVREADQVRQVSRRRRWRVHCLSVRETAVLSHTLDSRGLLSYTARHRSVRRAAGVPRGRRGTATASSSRTQTWVIGIRNSCRPAAVSTSSTARCSAGPRCRGRR